jgi:hypothetical protein
MTFFMFCSSGTRPEDPVASNHDDIAIARALQLSLVIAMNREIISRFSERDAKERQAVLLYHHHHHHKTTLIRSSKDGNDWRYTEHNPSKLDLIDETLRKYSGREAELWSKLQTNYHNTYPSPPIHERTGSDGEYQRQCRVLHGLGVAHTNHSTNC